MPNTILISEPDGRNTRRIPINGVSRSWSVDRPGTLSVETMSAALIREQLHGELRGHRILYQHDDAGTWGGVISDVTPAWDGTTEITAADLRMLFDKMRLPRRTEPVTGPAGSLSLMAITEATRLHGSPVVDRFATDMGTPILLDFDGGELRPKLDSMAAESGQEWWIDPDTLYFHWGIKGRDLTGSVQLIAPRHIATWQAPESIDPVVNDLEAFPINDRASALQTMIAEVQESITAIGRRQASEGIFGGATAIQIRTAAIERAQELAAMGRAIDMDVLNTDRCWGWFREGDTVCVLLPSNSSRLIVRIMARSVDDRHSVMNVSGIVLERRAM